jgi:hypothetical protein
VDEPQLQAGSFLSPKEHVWFSQHRWLLTGTPINATGELCHAWDRQVSPAQVSCWRLTTLQKAASLLYQ